MDENTVTRSRTYETGEYSESAELTESELHRLLARERRRHALDVLLDRSGPVDLEDLAVAVAEREEGLTAADDQAVERVKTTLHHVHLPLMAEADVLAYDIHETHVASCPTRSELPFY